MNSSPLIPLGLPTPPGEKKNPIPQFTSLYIQNETSKATNPTLRYRNRSQEPTTPRNTPTLHIPYLTPESPKKQNLSFYHQSSPDSGIDTTYYATPKCRLEPEFLNETESFESPLDYFQRHFYSHRRTALFNSDSGQVKAHQFLPVIIVTIILASAIFTLFAFKTAIGRNYNEQGDIIPSNGKYKSLYFAVKSWAKKIHDSGKSLPGDIKDENGEILTGKKAAIGYAHAIYKRAPGEVEIEFDIKEQGPEVDLEMEKPDTPKMLTQEEKIRRKTLLDKIAKSGSAGTNKPKEREVEKSNVVNNPDIDELAPNPKTENNTLDSPSSETEAKPKEKKQPLTKVKPVQTSKFESPIEVLNVGPRSRTSGFRPEEEDDPFRFN